MRCLIQRVTRSDIRVNNKVVAEIDRGLLIFVCALNTDTEEHAVAAANKSAALRIFQDDAGKMNKSVADIGGEVLIVSQFTLAADTSRGNRPGFSQAAGPDEGKRLYDKFCETFGDIGIIAKTGIFGADMQVSLTNDGPVTIWIDNHPSQKTGK